jgi:hypothetical protein
MGQLVEVRVLLAKGRRFDSPWQQQYFLSYDRQPDMKKTKKEILVRARTPSLSPCS